MKFDPKTSLQYMRRVGAASLLSLLLAESAFAGLPSVYLKLPMGPDGRVIKNPNGYSLIAATEDSNPRVSSSNQVYFFPNKNEVKVAGVNWSQTVIDKGARRGGLCDAMDNEVQAIVNLSDQIKTLAKADPELARRKARLVDAKLKAEAKEAEDCKDYDAVTAQLKEADERVKAANDRVTLASHQVAQCLQNGGDQKKCNKILDDAIDEQTKANDAKVVLVEKQAEVAPKCNSARKSLEYAKQDLADLENQYTRIHDVEKAMKEVRDGLEWYGTTQGGNIVGMWDDGFEDAKKQLEADNPWLTVKNLPRKQINIYLGGAEGAGKLPMFLGYTLAGKPVALSDSSSNLGSDTKPAPVKDGVNASSKENGGDYYSLLAATPFAIYPESMTGNSGGFSAQASVAGACGLLAQKSEGADKPAFVITSSSVFANASNTHVTAYYNVWKIYKKMEEMGTNSSGFLGMDRHAYHNLWENMNEGDDFRFEFMTDDPVESARLPEIRAQLKQELAARMAAGMSQMTHDISMPPQPEPGRIVGWNLNYEYFGLIKVFSKYEIFGSSSSSTNLESNLNRTVREEWTYQRTLPMVNTVSVVVHM